MCYLHLCYILKPLCVMRKQLIPIMQIFGRKLFNGEGILEMRISPGTNEVTGRAKLIGGEI